MSASNNEKFAIIKSGSGQSIVTVGCVIAVDLMESKENDSVTLDPLMISDDSGNNIYNKGKVVATVVSELYKGDKVVAYKKRRRTSNSRDIKGHKQKYTLIKVVSIDES